MSAQNNSMFKDRRLLIVSKHNKEQVLIPLFERHLQVRCVVTVDFDTDSFGTFSGEKERVESPIQTAKNKCLAAMEKYDCDLAIASEGSFGLHPFIFFCSADEEVLLLVDLKNNLEISHCEVSTQTNFNGRNIYSLEELSVFAEQCKFPEHALIIRDNNTDHANIIKGIKTWQDLVTHYKSFHSKHGKAFVETDMRAMNNPMRMLVIEKTAQQLIEKIQCLCPQCHFPGFSISKRIKGLLCKLCGHPTQSTRAYEYECQSCGFIHIKTYPNGQTKEQPMYCDHCNP